MDEMWTRLWADLAGRIHGPMTFRFILQPLMATLYAARDGMADARAGRPAYFWSLLTGQSAEGALAGGFKAVGRVIGLGILMEVAYQLIVLRWVYPGELLIVVLTLCFVPYLLMRGPANRITRWIKPDGR